MPYPWPRISKEWYLQAVTPPYWPRFAPAPGDVLFEVWAPPPPLHVPMVPPSPAEPPYGPDLKGSGVPPSPPDTPTPPSPFFNDTSITTLAFIADELPRFPHVAGVQFLLESSYHSPCSAACGTGLAVTPSACVSTAMHTSAPLEVCQAFLGADDGRLQECNMEPCSTTEAHWEVGPWSRSDVQCGGGLRSRDVRCVTAGVATADTAACGLLPLQQYLPSNTAPCVSFAWSTTPWSSCSRECGWGIVRRSASCRSSMNHTFDAAFCAVPAPVSEMDCYLRPCNVPIGAASAGGEAVLPSPTSALDSGNTRPQATLRRLLLATDLEEQEPIGCVLIQVSASQTLFQAVGNASCTDLDYIAYLTCIGLVFICVFLLWCHGPLLSGIMCGVPNGCLDCSTLL